MGRQTAQRGGYAVRPKNKRIPNAGTDGGECQNTLGVSAVFAGGLNVNRLLNVCFLLLPVVLAVACDPGTTAVESDEDRRAPAPEQVTRCLSSQVQVGAECVSPPDVKLNTVGYLLGRKKQATIPVVEGAETFQVVNIATNQLAFEGLLAAVTENADTADKTRVADFTSLEAPGTYVLNVAGLRPSPPFVIADNTLNEPLRLTMLGLYGLRCGVAIEIEHQGTHFGHAACHLEDAKRGEANADGTGGWHDAGDYGKYTVNASFALAFTLKAWEDFGAGLGTLQHIPNYAGTLPAWLEESKYQLDQILKMQYPDGGVAHMIGPYNPAGTAAPYPGTVMPEKDVYLRAFSETGTEATADFAAVTAMASRVFRAYDPAYADKCLAAALAAQAYLDANPDTKRPNLDAFTHYAYLARNGDVGDRFWALAELWRTTADPALLARVEAAMAPTVDTGFDWGNPRNLGVFSYVQAASSARDPAVFEKARAAVQAAANQLVDMTTQHAYGRALGGQYWWGSNGTVARSTLVLFVANALTPDVRYLDTAVQQIDFLLGRNVQGRSFLTGAGYLPAQKPHHRPSQADRAPLPWPGLLVGGANGRGDDEVLKAAVEQGVAPGLMWFDNAASYGSNEVAINWNTALAYALAGFYR